MYKVGDTVEIGGKKVLITYSDGRNFSYCIAPEKKKEPIAKEPEIEEPVMEEPVVVEDDTDTDDDEEIVFDRPKKARRKRR